MRNSDLREIRKAALSTIAESAAVAGVSVGSIWNWETGRAVPTEQQIKVLMAFYLTKIETRANYLRGMLGSRV
ncbi:MAG: helix-turn-helix domain-containing protein [Candidatus Acidiferrales bacterium]